MHNGRKKGVAARVRKAIGEYVKGKRVVMVYPLDKRIRMLPGALGQKSRRCQMARHIACFILDPD